MRDFQTIEDRVEIEESVFLSGPDGPRRTVQIVIYGRARKVMQVGTQSRSTAHVREAMRLLREGAIGDVLVAKAWNSQLRPSIGRRAPQEPPKELDYDTWVGPAT